MDRLALSVGPWSEYMSFKSAHAFADTSPELVEGFRAFSVGPTLKTKLRDSFLATVCLRAQEGLETIDPQASALDALGRPCAVPCVPWSCELVWLWVEARWRGVSFCWII